VPAACPHVSAGRASRRCPPGSGSRHPEPERAGAPWIDMRASSAGPALSRRGPARRGRTAAGAGTASAPSRTRPSSSAWPRSACPSRCAPSWSAGLGVALAAVSVWPLLEAGVGIADSSAGDRFAGGLPRPAVTLDGSASGRLAPAGDGQGRLEIHGRRDCAARRWTGPSLASPGRRHGPASACRPPTPVASSRPAAGDLTFIRLSAHPAVGAGRRRGDEPLLPDGSRVRDALAAVTTGSSKLSPALVTMVPIVRP